MSESKKRRHPRQIPRIDGARPAEVLLIEDNPGDVELTREALAESKVAVNLSVAGDGVDALAFLRREGKHEDAPRPDLIILDLNLPKKDGRQVLEEMKADRALSTIPVVVLTTSEAEEDVLRSYELHANAYVTKPLDFSRFNEIVQRIDEFWFTIVRLPGDKQRPE